MELKHLRIETQSLGWHRIWIDAQDRKLNVLFEELFDELRRVIDWLKANRDTSPVVLCSAKEKGFVVGADLKRIIGIKSDQEIQDFLKHGQDVLDDWEQLPNPTIAWIKGPCLGGGLELAMACKFRIVSIGQGTQLGMPESKLGLTPGWGGTQRLMRLVGVQVAMEMLLGGEPIDSQKAIDSGLADGAWNDQDPIDTQMVSWVDRLKKTISSSRFALQGLSQQWSSLQPVILEQLESTSQLEQDSAKNKACRQIVRCVTLGLEQGSAHGQRCEREGFYELLASPDCQSILAKFSQPKKSS